jgi:transposase
MERVPRLRRHQRRELIRLGRKSKDPQTCLRFLLVATVTSGVSRSEAARRLSAARSTAVSAVRRYMEHGIPGLYDRRRLNGATKVDEPFRTVLDQILFQTPDEFGWRRPTWTRELLCLEMERRGFPRVAVCTLGRALVDIGARLGRPKPIVGCPWGKRRKLRRLNELRRLAEAASPQEPVFFADEVDIHLNPKIGLDWMPLGFQRKVLTPGQNQKRYLAGVLNAMTGKLTWVAGDRKNSDLFCQLLWRLASEHRRARRIHIILDNYIIHSSRITQRCVAEFGGRIVLHFLPPYCPDANRIERVWLDLHANVTRNHRRSTMAALMADVVDFLQAYNRRRLLNPALRRERERQLRNPVRGSRSVI